MDTFTLQHIKRDWFITECLATQASDYALNTVFLLNSCSTRLDFVSASVMTHLGT